MTASIYYRGETTFNERWTELYEDTSFWNDTTIIHLISSEYSFDFIHVLEDLNDYIIGSTTIDNAKVININDRNILSSDNVNMMVNVSMLNSDVGGIIIESNDKLIFYIVPDDIEEYTINTKSIDIDFFNGYEKILMYDIEGDTSVGDILLYQKASKTIVRPPEIQTRVGGLVSSDEESNKEWLTGKASLYRDISITGRSHPLTGDLVSVSGAAAVNQSIRNILLANVFDRPFSSKDVAGNISRFLFEFNDSITGDDIKLSIATALTNNEPRITVIDITVDNNIESYNLGINIIYRIHMTNKTEKFSILLDRA